MTLPSKDLKNESSWINVAKACAIIGVVLQHVNGFLYTDQRILFVWFGVFACCLLASYKSNIFDIATGGGRLFAGSWLFFWFTGMFVRKAEQRQKRNISSFSRIIGYTLLLCLWELVFVVYDANQNFGPLFRKSGVGMTWANTLETFIVFFWFKNVVSYMETVQTLFIKRIISFFNYLGRHTLYIFLYHMLFVSIFRGMMPSPGRRRRESFMHSLGSPLWCLCL